MQSFAVFNEATVLEEKELLLSSWCRVVRMAMVWLSCLLAQLKFMHGNMFSKAI